MINTPYENLIEKFKKNIFEIENKYPFLKNIDDSQYKSMIKTYESNKDIYSYLIGKKTYFSLLEAQPLLVHEKAINDIESMIYQGNIPIMNDFKMPFNSIIVMIGNSDIPIDKQYFSIYKCNGTSYNYKNDIYPIYCFDFYNGEEVTFEFYFTPPLLPRVFMGCKDTKKCDKYNKANIFKDSKFFDNEEIQCLKSYHTCESCTIMIDDTITIANLAIHYMMIAYRIIEVFYTKPQHLQRNEKTGKILKDLKSNNNVESKMIISINKKSYTYTSFERINSEHEKRKSPCMHYRVEHERTLNNGKKIKIHETIVCKNNEKKIYKVDAFNSISG